MEISINTKRTAADIVNLFKKLELFKHIGGTEQEVSNTIEGILLKNRNI